MRGDSPAIAAFHQACQTFRAAHPDAEPQAAQTYPFFHAYYHLSEASTCLKRAQRAGAKHPQVRDIESQKLDGHWAAMEEIF